MVAAVATANAVRVATAATAVAVAAIAVAVAVAVTATVAATVAVAIVATALLDMTTSIPGVVRLLLGGLAGANFLAEHLKLFLDCCNVGGIQLEEFLGGGIGHTKG
jgi:hypothetical protein